MEGPGLGRTRDLSRFSCSWRRTIESYCSQQVKVGRKCALHLNEQSLILTGNKAGARGNETSSHLPKNKVKPRYFSARLVIIEGTVRPTVANWT